MHLAHRTPTTIAAGVTCLCLLWPIPSLAQEVTAAAVLARAADYAALFLERFANVVTEESYNQALERRVYGGWLPQQDRKIRSDFLIVKGGGVLEWTPLRDAFEVDGRPVRDREERLTKLFTESPTTALDQATRIADESARHNLGPGQRTTNTPELGILFLQRSVQPRFSFTLGPRDRSLGERVWIVEHRERARPTVVRNGDDGNLPASGRFSIDLDTGRVMQTTMTLRPPGGSWVVTTDFKYDADLGIAVPVQMREVFDMQTSRLRGTATYGRFRSFSVTTKDAVRQEGR